MRRIRAVARRIVGAMLVLLLPSSGGAVMTYQGGAGVLTRLGAPNQTTVEGTAFTNSPPANFGASRPLAAFGMTATGTQSTNGAFLPDSLTLNSTGSARLTTGNPDGSGEAISQISLIINNDASRPYTFTGSLGGPTFDGHSFIQLYHQDGSGDLVKCTATGPCNGSGTLSAGSYILFVNAQQRVAALGGFFGELTTFEVHLTLGAPLPATPTPAPTASPPVIRWINPAGGNYDDAANWDPARVPIDDADHDDNAAFDLAATYTVTVASAHTSRLIVRDSIMDVVGGTTEATASSLAEPSLVVGDGGVLHVVSGTFTTVHSVVGDVSGTLAQVDLVSGAPIWTNTGRLSVGDAGPGRLTVASGALISAESRVGGGTLGVGEAIVGGDATWTTGNLGLGLGGGAGTLEVKDGGTVLSDGAVIGVALSTGNVATVTGTVPGNDTLPSTWNVDTVLAVGKDGAGQLDVLAGGRVLCDTLRVATAPSGAATVTIDGSTADGTPPSTLKSDFSIEVGADGIGTLAVTHGGFVDAFSVAIGVNGPGTLTIEGTRPIPNDPEGAPSLLLASTDATVGVGALGTVDVRDNGQLTTPLLVIGAQATGVVTVDASVLASSQLIRVGGGAAGTLELDDGAIGLVHAIDLGADAAGAGFLILKGESPLGDPAPGFPSSIVADGDVRVGVLGEGSLTVEEGGELTIKTPARLEVTTAGGTATADRGRVTIAGVATHRSRIDAQGEIRIGGAGQVEAVDGGLVTVGGAALLGGGGPGVLSASGVHAGSGTPASVAVTGNLVVGTNGDGGDSVLSLSNGAQGTVGGQLIVGALGADNSAIVDGASGATRSRLDVTGAIRISEDSILSITSGAQVTAASAIVGDDGIGTLAVGSPPDAPALAVAGAIDVGLQATSTLALCPGGLVTAGGIVTIGPQGTLQGTGTLVTPQLVNSGTTAPGCSPGTLTIAGAYVQHASGRLRIEVGGTAPGTFDVLQIAGNATLDGTLEIAFVNGFVPRTDDALDVLQVAGAVAGDFTALTTSGLPPGWKVEPTRTGNVFGFHVTGDYLCYQTAAAKGFKFPKNLPGTLPTQLGALGFGITKPALLCNPSGPSTGSAQADADQLRGYVVADPSGDPLGIGSRTLRVTNGFHPGGELVVDTAAPSLVLAPASKCIDLPAGTCPGDLPPPSESDAFACARAKRSKSGPAFPKTLVASAVDGFGEPRTYKLSKPTRVCAPTTGDLGDALACYLAKPLGKACAPSAPVNAAGACKSELDCGGTKKVTTFCAKQSKHAKAGGLLLATTLAHDRAGTVKPLELCVPSTLGPP